jgi:hypothetical protein
VTLLLHILDSTAKARIFSSSVFMFAMSSFVYGGGSRGAMIELSVSRLCELVSVLSCLAALAALCCCANVVSKTKTEDGRQKRDRGANQTR